MTFDWQYLFEVAPTILNASIVTVAATFSGFFAALIFGLVIALLKYSPSRFVRYPVIAISEFVRATPLLVQIYFLFFVLPQFGVTLEAFTVGIVSIGLHFGTYIAEVYRAGIEAVPVGQWEASIALNLGRARTWTSIILPQAIRPVIPPLGNYLISMFKVTPYLAVITIHEMLGEALYQAAFSFRYLEPIILVGVLFFVMSYPSAALVRRLEARFAQK